MTISGQPVINIKEIEQLCFVVRSIDKSVESLKNNFGIGPWMFREFYADSMEDMTYHGKPGRFSFRVARLQNKLGGVELELVEPLEGDNIYRDFLREHGEGVHHVGWYKVDSMEAFNETSKALERAGFPCIMSGRTAYMTFAYFDTTRVLNTILEVLLPKP
jgi:methylmalonyl-CoA/ethylmalonyl-CoA epimerase